MGIVVRGIQAPGSRSRLIPWRAVDSRTRPILEELTRRRVPGLALIVVRRGIAEEACAAGLTDLASGAPTTPDSAHLWFSMTKIVTATAAMQLVDRQVIGLDDPVRDLLPEFPEPRAGWPVVRVRHLLSHSSGLVNPIPVRWVHAAGAPGRESHEFALALLDRHHRLRFRAGSRAAYSNLGYIALGEVVAAASGRPYEAHVRSQILEPLAMNRTGFSYEGMGDDVATGYQPRFHPMTPLFRLILPRGIMGPTSGRFVAFNRFCVDGAAYGGLIGSARDAARFMAAHLNAGELDGHRLLSPNSVEAMQVIQARGRRLDVGFGWFRRGAKRRSVDYVEHLGGGGGFWTMMRIYPQRGLGIVTMGNATSYDHERIASAVVAR
jgi:CubicO group peptidase (beta-lactamase class C family)